MYFKVGEWKNKFYFQKGVEFNNKGFCQCQFCFRSRLVFQF